jgi:hypothetical protein
VGKLITPLEATPPVPTLTVNAAVPLFVLMDGDVPKPEEMAGAVPEISILPVLGLYVTACTVAA